MPRRCSTNRSTPTSPPPASRSSYRGSSMRQVRRRDRAGVASALAKDFASRPLRNQGLASPTDFVLQTDVANLHLTFRAPSWKLTRVDIKSDLPAGGRGRAGHSRSRGCRPTLIAGSRSRATATPRRPWPTSRRRLRSHRNRPPPTWRAAAHGKQAATPTVRSRISPRPSPSIPKAPRL